MVRITRAIVHEIPKGRYSAEGPDFVGLSSSESDLAPQTRRFIEENMMDFALKTPRDIREDVDSSSITPDLVRLILGAPDEQFVGASQQIANNLFQAQTGNSPSGALIVALVDSNGVDSLVILKAEHSEGMQLRRTGDRYDLEHLNELIVGNNSRIYKIAVLHLTDELIVGQMMDQQNGVAFADFFVSAFLGCRLSNNSELLTKQFMHSAFGFVNDKIQDEEKQGRYATSLLAYISSQSPTFQVTDFADQFLDVEDRDGFIASMPESISNSVINKDLSLVPGRGTGLRLYGEGVMISASNIALERGALKILSEEGGQTVIEITGSLKKFGLGTAPKA